MSIFLSLSDVILSALINLLFVKLHTKRLLLLELARVMAWLRELFDSHTVAHQGVVA